METDINIKNKSRFFINCRKLAVEKKKILLWGSLGYIGIWIMFGIINGLFGGHPYGETFIVYMFLSGIPVTYVASMMFYELCKKDKKISLLMTPVSASDQFIPRLVVVVLGMLILTFVGYLVCGLANWGSYWIFRGEQVHASEPFQIWEQNSETLLFLCMIFSVFMIVESVFILGSVAWPKWSFLKTIVLISVIETGIGIIIGLLAKLLIDCGIYVEVYDKTSLLWSIVAFLTLLWILILYFSYFLFKRKTL